MFKDKPATGIGIGFLAGFFSGLLGVGGGVVLLPLLTRWFKLDQRTAQGTNLLVIVPLAMTSAANYLHFGNLNITQALWISIGSMLGVYGGAMLAHRIHSVWLTRGCGVLFIVAALRLLFAR